MMWLCKNIYIHCLKNVITLKTWKHKVNGKKPNVFADVTMIYPPWNDINYKYLFGCGSHQNKVVVLHHNITKLLGSLVIQCSMAPNKVVSIHVIFLCHHSSLGDERIANWSSTYMCHLFTYMDSYAPTIIPNPSTQQVLCMTYHRGEVIPCVLHSNNIS